MGVVLLQYAVDMRFVCAARWSRVLQFVILVTGFAGDGVAVCRCVLALDCLS